LNDVQKVEFIGLEEFQNIFSENIIAGNCSIVEHSIDIENSLLIKQSPRRIPLRGKVEEILDEMKQREVIEESQSPWVFPAVLERKRMVQLGFALTIGNSMLLQRKILTRIRM